MKMGNNWFKTTVSTGRIQNACFVQFKYFGNVTLCTLVAGKKVFSARSICNTDGGDSYDRAQGEQMAYDRCLQKMNAYLTKKVSQLDKDRDMIFRVKNDIQTTLDLKLKEFQKVPV